MDSVPWADRKRLLIVDHLLSLTGEDEEDLL
jgi:hypothetical protein